MIFYLFTLDSGAVQSFIIIGNGIRKMTYSEVFGYGDVESVARLS